MNKIKWFVVSLFLVISHFLQAELTVWAYKGNVRLQGNTQITLAYQVQEKDTLSLIDSNSYLALYNKQTNKIVEIKGQQSISYDELKKKEEQAIQLPMLTDFYKYNVIGSITCGMPSIVLYPEDKNEFFVTRKDTLIFHYKILNKKDTVKAKVTTLYEDVLMTVPVLSENHSILIPIDQLPRIEGSIYIVNVEANENEKRLAIRIVEETSVVREKKKQLTQLLQNDQLVNKVYAMIWAFEQEMYIEGYKLFTQLPSVANYHGYQDYYQFLKVYYQGE